MKICVATLCSPDCAALGAVTEPNKNDYCQRHGYDFLVRREGFIGDPKHGHHRFVFERFRFFRDCLQSYDAVLGCGADVAITNPAVKLEDLMEWRKPFIIAKDALGLQTDVMLMRNRPDVISLLSAVVAAENRYWNAPYLDQSALTDIAPLYADTIEVVPQRLINAYDYNTLTAWHSVHQNYWLAKDADGNDGQWQPGDFILHCPGLPMERKLQVLREHVNNL